MAIKKTEDQKLKFVELINTKEIKDRFIEIMGEANALAFLQTSIQVVSKDTELMKAEPNSIVNAIYTGASLGLMIEPQFGQFFVQTYKVKEGLVWHTFAQFVMGWKGYVQLSYRSDMIKKVNPSDVREGEFVRIDRMRDEIEFDWNQDQDGRKKLPIIGFVAYFQLTNGGEKSFYMTDTEMKAHAKEYSKKYNDKDGFWLKDYVGQGKKTVLKLLLDKFAPKSKDLHRAIRFDQAIIGDMEGNKLNYIDNPKTKPKKVDLDEKNKAVEKQRFLDL